MSRANIARIHADGSGQFIYLHYGEPLEGGIVLLENYQTSEQIQHLLALGDLSSIGPIIGEQVDLETWVSPNSLSHTQCLAYHRDRNDSWEDCQPRQLSGGLDQFLQDSDIDSEWLYAHTPDGWTAWLHEPDSRWGSIPDAILADASERLARVRKCVQEGVLPPLALERLVEYIATTTARPWHTPALRQLLDQAISHGQTEI